MSEDLRDAEYRARRTTARLNRDEDLGDARAARNAGDIDSPEKKARIEAIRSRFAAFGAMLLSRHFEAGGDAATPGNAAPRADVPTATRGDVPLLEQTVYVRVKEDRQVLASRIGIAAGQTTTYLDLARVAVLHYLRSEDWFRVAARPMIVETFSDFHETEPSKVEMPIGANAISNINKYIRVTVQSPAPPPAAARRNGADVLMQASRRWQEDVAEEVEEGVEEGPYTFFCRPTFNSSLSQSKKSPVPRPSANQKAARYTGGELVLHSACGEGPGLSLCFA
ncbi:hypothetical protein M885DRAFT_306310 [Pelagophyceae sp. CCMP2097]|nr:hypothetical protein M885DRAFT_306310 [Pelagophyceae sp. CCMP2097]